MIASFTPDPHSNTISDGQLISGIVVSSMVNVALVLLLFPHPSVAVNSTSMLPVMPQSGVRSPTKSFVHSIGSLQASVAVAPPLLLIHACKAVLCIPPSHSTVSSIAAVIAGGTRSSLIYVARQLLVFPAASVTVNK